MIRRVFTGPAAITAAMVVLAACLQIGLGALFPAHGQTAPAASGAPLPFWTERPCPLEDSVNCAWDAGTMGDGNGHSFTVPSAHRSADRQLALRKARWSIATAPVCTRWCAPAS